MYTHKLCLRLIGVERSIVLKCADNYTSWTYDFRHHTWDELQPRSYFIVRERDDYGR